MGERILVGAYKDTSGRLGEKKGFMKADNA